MWRLPFAAALVAGVGIFGACTQRVTRDDVTAARHEVDQQRQELRDAQDKADQEVTQQAREAADARHEALKPATGLEPLTRPDPAKEERDVIEAARTAEDKIRAEARDLTDAQRELADKEAKLRAEERGKELERTSKLMLDEADRRIAGLKQRAANAPDDGGLKTQIGDVQNRRDRLQTAINNFTSATDANRAAADSEVMKALAELDRELAANR